MVGEYVLSNAHNYNLTPKFAIFSFSSYFMAQEGSVPPKVSTTTKVILTYGFVFGSSLITRVRDLE
jgi:hypothetical protein